MASSNICSACSYRRNFCLARLLLASNTRTCAPTSLPDFRFLQCASDHGRGTKAVSVQELNCQFACHTVHATTASFNSCDLQYLFPVEFRTYSVQIKIDVALDGQASQAQREIPAPSWIYSLAAFSQEFRMHGWLRKLASNTADLRGAARSGCHPHFETAFLLLRSRVRRLTSS